MPSPAAEPLLQAWPCGSEGIEKKDVAPSGFVFQIVFLKPSNIS